MCRGTCYLNDHFLCITRVSGTSYTLVGAVKLGITLRENYAQGHFIDKDIDIREG